jgi:uroporphyrinogen-III synthase
MAVIIKKMLVSQPRPASGKSPYFDIAEKYGVEVDFRPFIKIEPLSAKEFRQQRISILDYSSVIFTARTAVDHFFRLCDELRITIPEMMKYFCMTETIAVYLQKYIVYRKRKVFFGQNGKQEDLVKLIGKHSKEKYLIPVSDVHKDDLMKSLATKKINHKTAIMFRTVSNNFTDNEKFDYDMLVFFSPSGISSLLKNFPEFKQENIRIGCFGPTTAKAALDAGLRLDIEAPTPDAPSMTAALEQYLKKEMGQNKKNGSF